MSEETGNTYATETITDRIEISMVNLGFKTTKDSKKVSVSDYGLWQRRTTGNSDMAAKIGSIQGVSNKKLLIFMRICEEIRTTTEQMKHCTGSLIFSREIFLSVYFLCLKLNRPIV